MKKIIMIFTIICIFSFPTICNAKFDYNLTWSIAESDDLYFLYRDKDGFHFVDSYVYFVEEADNLITYDLSGNFVKEEKFFDSTKMSYEQFYNSKRFLSYMVQNANQMGEDLIITDDSYFCTVSYYNKNLSCFNNLSEDYLEMDFYDDLNSVKKIMGKKFDIYNLLKEKNYEARRINVFDNVSIVYYEDEEYYENFLFLDKNNNIVFDYNSEQHDYLYAKEMDGLLYLSTVYNKIDVYTEEGKKVNTINIESDYFDDDKYSVCGSYNLLDFDLYDHQLFVFLKFEYCPTRVESNGVSDLVNEKVSPPTYLYLNYDLVYDINKIDSDKGDFTYESKVDKDGNEYVELNIIPKKGYSVDKIIVTDLNGNNIEVKDNKFYMPMNAVNIEIKYIDGQYVEIPNTSLNKNISFLIIGFLLIGFGIYTIDYIKDY